MMVGLHDGMCLGTTNTVWLRDICLRCNLFRFSRCTELWNLYLRLAVVNVVRAGVTTRSFGGGGDATRLRRRGLAESQQKQDRNITNKWWTCFVFLKKKNEKPSTTVAGNVKNGLPMYRPPHLQICTNHAAKVYYNDRKYRYINICKYIIHSYSL